MHLADTPSYSIMTIGRWGSNAFLLYIRRAVQEFSGKIAKKMLHGESFFSLSSFTKPPNSTLGSTANAGDFATACGRAFNLRLISPFHIWQPAPDSAYLSLPRASPPRPSAQTFVVPSHAWPAPQFPHPLSWPPIPASTCLTTYVNYVMEKGGAGARWHLNSLSRV